MFLLVRFNVVLLIQEGGPHSCICILKDSRTTPSAIKCHSLTHKRNACFKAKFLLSPSLRSARLDAVFWAILSQ